MNADASTSSIIVKAEVHVLYMDLLCVVACTLTPDYGGQRQAEKPLDASLIGQ